MAHRLQDRPGMAAGVLAAHRVHRARSADRRQGAVGAEPLPALHDARSGLLADRRRALRAASSWTRSSDWIARNPWGYGVNWACAMDVALRAVSWIWGFYFIGDAAGLPLARRSAARSSARCSCTASSSPAISSAATSTAITICATASAWCFWARSSAAPRTGARWLADRHETSSTPKSSIRRARTASTSRSRRPITGSCSKRSSPRTCCSSAWRAAVARHGSARLERMLEFVEAYTKPDGTVPLVGDADDGRVQKLGVQGINDHRYLLSTGAVLFERGDFKRAARRVLGRGVLAARAGGGRARSTRSRPPTTPVESKAFRRRRLLRPADRSRARLRRLRRGRHARPRRPRPQRHHQPRALARRHEPRHRLRRLPLHRVARVAEPVPQHGVPQRGAGRRRGAEPADLSRSSVAAARRCAAARCGVAVGDRADYFRGGHNGYARLDPPVRVTREVLLVKDGPDVLDPRLDRWPRLRTSWCGAFIWIRRSWPSVDRGDRPPDERPAARRGCRWSTPAPEFDGGDRRRLGLAELRRSRGRRSSRWRSRAELPSVATFRIGLGRAARRRRCACRGRAAAGCARGLAPTRYAAGPLIANSTLRFMRQLLMNMSGVVVARMPRPVVQPGTRPDPRPLLAGQRRHRGGAAAAGQRRRRRTRRRSSAGSIARGCSSTTSAPACAIRARRPGGCRRSAERRLSHARQSAAVDAWVSPALAPPVVVRSERAGLGRSATRWPAKSSRSARASTISLPAIWSPRRRRPGEPRGLRQRAAQSGVPRAGGLRGQARGVGHGRRDRAAGRPPRRAAARRARRVLGLGLIGQITVQLLKAAGCRVDRPRSRSGAGEARAGARPRRRRARRRHLQGAGARSDRRATAPIAR